MTVLRLAEVEVEIGERDVTTRFPGGAVLHACPNYDAESIERARELGYSGTDREVCDAMTREHDVLHSMIAALRGQPWSATLYAAATGTEVPEEIWRPEEALVFDVTKALNGRRLPG